MNDLKTGLIGIGSARAGDISAGGSKEGMNGLVRTMGYAKTSRTRSIPMEDSDSDLDSYSSEESLGAKPDIYTYDSHQDFLRDRFLWVQSQNPKFSHRVLAKAAGFANPGFFNDILKGRRKVNSIGLERFGRALGLESDELEFAQCLMVVVVHQTTVDLYLAWAVVDRVLDILRIVVDAAHDDDILDAACDEQLSGFVDEAEIASA